MATVAHPDRKDAVSTETPVLRAKPVAVRDVDYQARVAKIKRTYPKILARLAE